MSWWRFIFTRAFWRGDTSFQVARILAMLFTLVMPWVVYAGGPGWFVALWVQSIIAAVALGWFAR